MNNQHLSISYYLPTYIVAEKVRNVNYLALPGGEEVKINWDPPDANYTDSIAG